jgi:hypothetical protein
MTKKPQWIAARLGDDYNWWVESTSLDDQSPKESRAILDPRQVSHLGQILEEYRPHGLSRQQLDDAFTLFTLENEIEDGRVRLVPSGDDTFGDGKDVFALPAIDADGDGPYYDFLDAVIAARVRYLNATHGYLTDCTAEDLTSEVELLAADRYFSDETRHCFDEINEILEWEPAEWDEPSEP